jgi:hypothetical protein
MGYTAGESKMSMGAFYEAGPDSKGRYRGAILPGPGILCFRRHDAKGLPKAGDSIPAMSFPHGKDGFQFAKMPFAIDGKRGEMLQAQVPISNKPLYAGLSLWQYDAVIAINPKEDAKEFSFEIRLDFKSGQ